MKINTTWKDERCNYSSSRILLWLWTALVFFLLLRHPDILTNAILAFLSTVYMALVCWAAGPRISQYIGPQLGQAANAIGQAKSVEMSTDIAEIRARLEAASSPTNPTTP